MVPVKHPQKLIRLSKSSITQAEKDAVAGVLDREFLGMGSEVQQFEQLLSNYFERPAVCVVNGTAALHLALQAVGIGVGDEVLVPSLTYVASFQAISATGAIPVACDIDPETLCLDWRDAEKRTTENTKAIMPVHYSGGVGDIKSIYNLAERHNLRVIEDAAHAFGTKYNNNKVGSFGDVACFSFDGIKNITSGEGGCIVSHDETLLQGIRDSRLLGVEKDTEKRFSGERSWEFSVSNQGWRYHMSNIMAAIGIEQMKRFPAMAEKRQHLAQRYVELLSKHSFIKIIRHNYNEVVPHIFVIQLPNQVSRESVIKNLADKKIQTGIHYMPNHYHRYYLSQGNTMPLPVTEQLFPRLLSLPLQVDMTADDVEWVVQSLVEAIS